MGALTGSATSGRNSSIQRPGFFLGGEIDCAAEVLDGAAHPVGQDPGSWTARHILLARIRARIPRHPDSRRSHPHCRIVSRF
ncbi:unnamed protein product [Urochloa humidicola]